MDNTTPNNRLNNAQDNAYDENASASKQAKDQWIKLPDGLMQWLSKRIDFSLPTWVLAVAAVIVMLMIFD